MNTYIEQYK